MLYINDTRRGHIRAFDMLPNGTLARASDRVFADLRGAEPGVPDVHGAPATTNIAFGGDDWKTLYFTSRNHLGSVRVKIPGIPVPVRTG